MTVLMYINLTLYEYVETITYPHNTVSIVKRRYGGLTQSVRLWQNIFVPDFRSFTPYWIEAPVFMCYA